MAVAGIGTFDGAVAPGWMFDNTFTPPVVVPLGPAAAGAPWLIWVESWLSWAWS
jgi:hypothetical protein